MEYILMEAREGKLVRVLHGNAQTAVKKLLLGLKEDELDKVLASGGLSRHSIQLHDTRIHLIYTRCFSQEECTGFLSQVLSYSDHPMHVYDNNGRIIYGNRTLERFGVSLEKILGKTAMYLVEQGFADKTPIGEVLRSRKCITLEQKTASGQHLLVTAIPHLQEDGEVAFIVENCTNNTELESIRLLLKEKELEAARYKAEAESFKRLEEKSLSGHFEFGYSMQAFSDKILRAAKTNATLLILGESGTGKSYVAQYIHKNSPRAAQPFICINCSSIAPSLFESELFGYAPGAFTGAGPKGKTGLIELANSGTLFLDEIGDVPLNLQVKLLELIQEKRYLPIGALRYKSADLKIIAATNRDLKKLVDNHEFREDLYYRLKVIEMEMPPLRRRQPDIDSFITYFINQYNKEYGFKKYISKEARSILNAYQWPGNIRELQNLVHNLVIMVPNDEIQLSDLPEHMLTDTAPNEDATAFRDLVQMLEAYERALVERCYQINKSTRKVAQSLNISQTKASRLIRKYIR